MAAGQTLRDLEQRHDAADDEDEGAEERREETGGVLEAEDALVLQLHHAQGGVDERQRRSVQNALRINHVQRQQR